MNELIYVSGALSLTLNIVLIIYNATLTKEKHQLDAKNRALRRELNEALHDCKSLNDQFEETKKEIASKNTKLKNLKKQYELNPDGNMKVLNDLMGNGAILKVTRIDQREIFLRSPKEKL